MRAYAIMTTCVGVGTILATFSKENGAALVLIVLCLEVTVVSASNGFSKLNRLWKWGALILPSIILAALLLKGPMISGWFQDYGTRDFSPYERLLTQFRIVLSYLYSWFIPNSSGGQIFYDDLVVSRGLFSPVTTFFSAVLVIGLVSLSVIKRRTWPVAAFTVLFYFSSLVIESTTIGLEMKFDHRIYLGSAFLFLPIVMGISKNLRPFLKAILGTIVIVFMAGLTFSASSLWGDYQKLTMVWATQKPDSVRSQTEAAQMLFSRGRVFESRDLLGKAADRMPDDFRLRLTQVLVQCLTGGARPEDLAAVLALSDAGPYRYTDFNLLDSLLKNASNNDCRGITSRDALLITEKLLKNSPYRSPEKLAYAHLHYYYGLALIKVGEGEKGVKMLDKALESRSSLHMRMNIAAYKASAGLLEQALNDARFVKERLMSGDIAGRAAVESPPLDEVEHFIRVLEGDIEGNKDLPEDQSRPRSKQYLR
jgi:tetratricopeptide (TPR) repeat protein